MQIQPRPLTILKKNELNADSVRKAPPTPSARCPTMTAPHPHRGDTDALRLDGGRILADRADGEAQRRAIEDVGEHATLAKAR